MRAQEPVPAEVREILTGFSLLAAVANVVMQLSLLPIGRGVAESRVASGRADLHPVKRLRTTTAYLAVALLGDEQERIALRREVNRSHRHVHSLPDDPVAYDAFDPELQLWVAACLYKGAEDLYRLLHPQPDPAALDRLYRYDIRLATTLQVPAELWPADREAFAAYWERQLSQVSMDEVTRAYLWRLIDLEALRPRLGPLWPLIRATDRFFTLGFLPESFRRELGMSFSAQQERRFRQAITGLMRLGRWLPEPVMAFPYNLVLWDTRRRLAAGRPVV